MKKATDVIAVESWMNFMLYYIVCSRMQCSRRRCLFSCFVVVDVVNVDAVAVLVLLFEFVFRCRCVDVYVCVCVLCLYNL